MKTLYINNNQLTRIDSNLFQGVTSLELFFMHDNQILYFKFVDLINLQKLDLKNNRFKSFNTPYFFGNLSLTLERIILETLYPDVFIGLFKLETLLLNNNLLTKLSKNQFANLTFLTLLELQLNLITQIEPYTFMSLLQLKYLVQGFKQLVDLRFEWF